jgi:hypothetical protein
MRDIEFETTSGWSLRRRRHASPRFNRNLQTDFERVRHSSVSDNDAKNRAYKHADTHSRIYRVRSANAFSTIPNDSMSDLGLFWWENSTSGELTLQSRRRV